MSHGTVVFFLGDGAQDSVEYANGHGMGPAVWDEAYRTVVPHGHKYGAWDWLRGLGESWSEIRERTRTFPMAHRNLLLVTLREPTLVARQHWPEVVDSILVVFGVLPSGDRALDVERLRVRLESSPVVNHWGEVALELVKRMDGPEVAFGLQNTSVNENPFKGERDPETGERLPYDPFADDNWVTLGLHPTRGVYLDA